MTGLPEFFQQTSDEPYNRHDYKLVYTNGNTKVFEDHQEFMAAWFQYPKQLLSHGEVLDKKVKKTKIKANRHVIGLA